MAYVYILYSEKLGKFYTGSCLDYAGRLQDHKMRADITSFTAKADDWDEFFVIPDLSGHQARSIEKHIKLMKSSTYIRNLKKYPELVQKLKDLYS